MERVKLLALCNAFTDSQHYNTALILWRSLVLNMKADETVCGFTRAELSRQYAACREKAVAYNLEMAAKRLQLKPTNAVAIFGR